MLHQLTYDKWQVSKHVHVSQREMPKSSPSINSLLPSGLAAEVKFIIQDWSYLHHVSFLGSFCIFLCSVRFLLVTLKQFWSLKTSSWSFKDCCLRSDHHISYTTSASLLWTQLPLTNAKIGGWLPSHCQQTSFSSSYSWFVNSHVTDMPENRRQWKASWQLLHYLSELWSLFLSQCRLNNED